MISRVVAAAVKKTMKAQMNSIRLALETVSHGPFYSLAQWRIRQEEPLDAEENWHFWTSSRNSLLVKALAHYPPGFLRKILVNAKLKTKHEVGIAAHYDLSNEFYKLFLDKKYIFYSCADFHRRDETLEQAQENKANFILKLIDPQPGERILELGCGWGAMLRRIYEATNDCEKLSGYTLSREQLAFIKERYGFNVSFTNFITAPYAESSFDKIYSIGAWEHVRPREIPVLLEKLHHALTPGGKLIQHFFCLSSKMFPTSMVMAQIFFPGSVLTPYADQASAWQRAGFRLAHESIHDYRPTLKAWYDNLVANKEQAIELVGVNTFNKYMVFFPASWRVFNEGQAQVHRLILEKS